MTPEERLAQVISAIGQDIKSILSNLGDKVDLTTINRDNIVSSTNELNYLISGLRSDLDDIDLSSYALKTYVDLAISNLINDAPGALDTLNELSNALGNDPEFATTLLTLIATKLDSNSIIDGGQIS